jgi:UTP-glucose-1-phosphate uridylyltransferase
MEKKITKAVFPAAGRGTLFLPAIRAIPKNICSVIVVNTIARKKIHTDAVVVISRVAEQRRTPNAARPER